MVPSTYYAHKARYRDGERRSDRAKRDAVLKCEIQRVWDEHCPWRTIEDVEFATLKWVDWFNHRRLLEPIGNIPPAECEFVYYQQQQGSAMVA